MMIFVASRINGVTKVKALINGTIVRRVYPAQRTQEASACRRKTTGCRSATLPH